MKTRCNKTRTTRAKQHRKTRSGSEIVMLDSIGEPDFDTAVPDFLYLMRKQFDHVRQSRPLLTIIEG